MADDFSFNDYMNDYKFGLDPDKKMDPKTLAKRAGEIKGKHMRGVMEKMYDKKMEELIDITVDDVDYHLNNERLVLDEYKLSGINSTHSNYVYKFRDMSKGTPYYIILADVARSIVWGIYKSVDKPWGEGKDATTMNHLNIGFVNVRFEAMSHGKTFSERLDLTRFPKRYNRAKAVEMWEYITTALMVKYYETIIDKYDDKIDTLTENLESLRETLITVFDRPVGKCLKNKDIVDYNEIKGIKLLKDDSSFCGSLSLLYLLEKNINKKLINKFKQDFTDFKTFTDFENFTHKVKIWDINKRLIYTSSKDMVFDAKTNQNHSFHILYHKEHYTPITNINSFVRTINDGKAKYCEKCNKSTKHKVCNMIKYPDGRKLPVKKKDTFKKEEDKETSSYCYDIESFSRVEGNKNYNDFAMLITRHINKENKHKVFRDIGQFLEYFTKKDRKIRLWAHNAAGYDSRIICDYLVKNKQAPKNVIQNGTKIVRFTYKKLEFVDSYKHLPMSLARAASTFGLKEHKGFFPYLFYTEENKNYKGPIPDMKHFDINVEDDKKLLEFTEFYTDFKNKRKIYDIDVECVKYCKLDVDLLCNVIKAYNRLMISLGIDAMNKNTLSSVSMKLFKNKFLKYDIPKNINVEVDNFGRKALYGGRTETINLKADKALYMDINSLYPSVQKGNRYPIGMPIVMRERALHRYNESTEKINKYLLKLDKTKVFIAKITVKKSNFYMPLLPSKINNRLIFDNRRKTGHWTSPEIIKAIKIGYVIEKIHKIMIYDYVTDLFDDYIDTLWQIKLKAKEDRNEGMYTLSKLLLNSLWGKFGQKKIQMMNKYCNEKEFLHLCGREAEKKIVISDKRDYDKDFSLVSYYGNTYGGDINSSIAAFVTAYGRLRLYEAMEAIGFENVNYMDTDSLVVSNLTIEDIKKKVVIGDGLGEWGLEENGQILTNFVSIGPKSYGYIVGGKEVTKCKGFTKGSVTHAVYSRMLEEYEQIKDKKGKEREKLIKNGVCSHELMEKTLHRRNLSIYFENKAKMLSMNFTKRIVNKDFTTSPINSDSDIFNGENRAISI